LRDARARGDLLRARARERVSFYAIVSIDKQSSSLNAVKRGDSGVNFSAWPSGFHGADFIAAVPALHPDGRQIEKFQRPSASSAEMR